MPYLTHRQVQETLTILRDAQRSLSTKSNAELRERLRSEIDALTEAWLSDAGHSMNIRGRKHQNGSFTFRITLGAELVRERKTLIWALADRRAKPGALGDLVMSNESLLFYKPTPSKPKRSRASKRSKPKSHRQAKK